MTRHDWRRHLVRFALAVALGCGVGACRCLVDEEEEPLAPALRAERDREPSRAGARPRRVREATLAGSWYPADPDELRRSVEGWLDAARPADRRRPMALIEPHAGHRFSGATAAWGYRTVKGASLRRVFVIAPTHHFPMEGAVVPAADAFETPLGLVPVDTTVTSALADAPGFTKDDRPHEPEHAIEIQLPFLQVALRPGFRIVPILVGRADVEAVRHIAAQIRPFVGPDDLVVASSDFTHYGSGYDYVPFTEDVPSRIEELDMGAFERIRSLSVEDLAAYKERTGITVCGIRPILALLAMLPQGTEAKLLHHDTSGRQTEDYSNSVSYLAIEMLGAGWPATEPRRVAGVRELGGPSILTHEEQLTAISLARDTLERFVRSGRVPDLDDLGVRPTGTLREKYGVFVTLKIGDRLRGCIGFTQPVDPLGEAIVSRTIAAAAHDPRFRPVRPDELERIWIEVSVLSRPRVVDGYGDIRIGRHGIILEKEGRGAVYLPHVPVEEGWGLEETLTHLSEKADLPGDAWREGADFAVFEAQLFGEVLD